MSTAKSEHEEPKSNHEEHEEFVKCKRFVSIVFAVFMEPSSIYSCKYDDIDLRDYSVFINIVNKESNDECAVIEYNAPENTVHIQNVNRCSSEGNSIEGSGTDIMQKLMSVKSHYQDSNLIIMVDKDESKITVGSVEFDLNWLYIFATGESWYNSFGFKEEEYDYNSTIINEFIDQPYNGKTIRDHFQKIKRDLRVPRRVSEVQNYQSELKETRKEFLKFLKKKDINLRQFEKKFNNIIYDNSRLIVARGKTRNRRSKLRINKQKMKTVQKQKNKKIFRTH